MPKRNRTKSRFADMFHLAVSAHTNNWSADRCEQELEDLLAKNEDLLDERAKNTARSEFRVMADPKLSGSLPKIQALTDQVMDAEPPGTSRRFQHEFLNICRKVLKLGVGAAVREVDQSLKGK
jgi:hypothetical protein